MISKLPVTVVVAHRPDRDSFFHGWCLPSIEANRPERIVVIDEAGQVAVMRNRGSRGVKTPYLFHADDDIILRADILEKEIAALETDSGSSFAYSDFSWVTLEDAPSHPYRPVERHRAGEFDPERLKTRCYIDTSSLMRTASFIEFDEDPDVRSMHDWEYFLRASLLGQRGVWVPEALYWVFNLDLGLTAEGTRQTAEMKIRKKFGL